jgi:preprotein translocase subunit SecE
LGKLRGNIRDILSELRKVTWPTREETRNLTIVVVGISATIGILLGGLDALLAFLYRLVNPI